MSLAHLIGETPLPPLYRVRCRFDQTRLDDVRAAARKTLEESGLGQRIRPGARIAVGVGSRGIHDLPRIVRAVVDWMLAHGARPFLVPCMGSHGGATPEGQRAVLRELGVTEESAGCPIESTMDVVELGQLEAYRLPVYMDALAHGADGVFVINRVKPHTSFDGPHESGLVKMLTIGLGKQKGADACHDLGYAHFAAVMPAMARVALESGLVLGGLAVVENAYDHPFLLEAVPAERLLERDAALLRLARELMPALPVNDLDVLAVDRLGKNISGTGMDTNITGRFLTPYKRGDVHIRRVAVLDITPESKGNAVGIGCADVITERLWGQINYDYTYANVITSTVLQGAFTPLVLASDEQALRACVKTCNAGSRPVRMLRIRDTLHLGTMLASEALLDKLPASCTVLDDVHAWDFDDQGNLRDMDTWHTFR